jgi:hypothetical protein
MTDKNVVFGGKDFVIHQQPIRSSRVVRQFLQEKIDEFGAVMSFDKVDITDGQALQKIIEAAKGLILQSPDLALDVVCMYAPDIDRIWIEDNATDDEAITAMIEVVKLLYPFGGIRKSLAGLTALTTSMNSASRSTGDGQTK